jgi:Na+-transporting methylmalonyl-CoA/oxaloacetate decarboxylase gamma subunit
VRNRAEERWSRIEMEKKEKKEKEEKAKVKEVIAVAVDLLGSRTD